MNRLNLLLLASTLLVITAWAQELGVTGNLHVAPEYWSKIGMDDDTKFGVGLGLTAGLALDFDGTKFSLGPHFGANRWSADYSGKDQSATQSVYAELMDLGIQFALADLDSTDEGMILWGGMGEGTLGMGMVLEGGETFKYPELDGSTYTYYEVGIGWKFGLLFVAPSYVSYKGRSELDRMELRVGVML